jgi:hypothetical protein
MKSLINRWIVSLICAVTLGSNVRAAEPTILFVTEFESTEGYSTEADLAGQNGWVAEGSTSPFWNGILANVFEGLGQQAYVGFTAPTDGSTFMTVWRPNLPAVPANQPLVKFSTLMAILDSTNERYDDFRWSVYNTAGERLFTLDFDNHGLMVNYALDDGNGFISTGKAFEPNHIYELVISMDLARNRWSARIDDIILVTEQPMTTKFASLAISDVDAVWSIRDAANPGNNYMAFDNYALVAYSNAIPPLLQNVSRLPDGSNLLRLSGEPNRQYVLEASANLQIWTPIKTNSPPDGIFEHLDLDAINQPARFYRAKVN